jgi:hypothetical protein
MLLFVKCKENLKKSVHIKIVLILATCVLTTHGRHDMSSTSLVKLGYDCLQI